MSDLLITPDVKISQVLESYPQLESVLIGLAPEFKKLSNPILRRTIARVTSLKQAAVVGNIELSHLINSLRKAIGQDEKYLEENSVEKTGRPVWLIDENIAVTYEASDDLKNGVHPMNKVVKEAGEIEKEKIYCMITDFVPVPLIDILKQRGHEVYSEKNEKGMIATYIRGK